MEIFDRKDFVFLKRFIFIKAFCFFGFVLALWVKVSNLEEIQSSIKAELSDIKVDNRNQQYRIDSLFKELKQNVSYNSASLNKTSNTERN